MYLVSIYFDKQTENRLQNLINRVAKATGNTFMLDNQVPPHITVASIETRQEAAVIEQLERSVPEIDAGNIQLVSVGVFLPQVIYVEPVLSEYLHNLSARLTEDFSKIDDTICSPHYQPFHWLPHCTVAKQLSKEQMVEAYKVLQNHFVPLEGRVVRLGIAKTNPHRDIKVWELG